MRDTSQYMINQDTKTPLTDVLEISRILDSFDNTVLLEFDEKYMMGIFYIFATEEEPELSHQDASSKFIQWFNEEKIDTYLQQMSEEAFKSLERIWQDIR